MAGAETTMYGSISKQTPGRAFQSERWLLVAAVLFAYSAALAVVGSALFRAYGFPIDDSYIHQTIARNFARDHVLGLLAHHRSSGSTSLLWTVFQAINQGLLHRDPVAFNLGVSWILLCAVGLLLLRLALRDGLPWSTSVLFAMAPACCGNFVWLGLLGMEHLLFVVLILAAVSLWSDEELSRPAAALAGACAGLCALTRPEALVLGPVLGLAGWRIRRSAKEMRTFAAAWLPFFAIYLAATLYLSHSLFPTTMKGRAWLYFTPMDGAHSLKAIVNFPVLWIFIRQQQFCLQPDHPRSTICLLLISSLLLIVGAAWLAAKGGIRIRLILIIAAVFFVVFWGTFPVDGHGGRYQPLNLLLLFPCVFLGLRCVMLQVRGREGTELDWVGLAVLLVAGSASLLMWRTIAVDGIAHINDTHGRAAAWLNQNVPDGERAAAFDVGRVSYDWDHGMLDLGGLADSSYLPYLEEHRVPEYIRQQRVEYVVLAPGGWPAYLGFRNGSLRKLAEFCSPYHAWKIAFFYTTPSGQCQIIYRVDESIAEDHTRRPQ